VIVVTPAFTTPAPPTVVVSPASIVPLALASTTICRLAKSPWAIPVTLGIGRTRLDTVREPAALFVSWKAKSSAPVTELAP